MKPIHELVIVETTTGLAGPLVSRPLADMGACVFKIESAARVDNNRLRVPPPGMSSASMEDVINVHEVNAGKHSVELNLKDARGRDDLFSLLRAADVYVENFAPGWLERIGLSHAKLAERFPQLIIVAQSAYGEEGPLRDRRAYAPVMTALSGLESVVGYPDGRIVPQMAGAVGDIVAANYGLLCALAGLIGRARTGYGMSFDISQIEASACIAGIAFASFDPGAQPPAPLGNRDPRYAPHDIYRAGGTDKWIAISVYSDYDWDTLCHELGVTDAQRARFASANARLAAVDEIDELICPYLRERDGAELAQRLRDVGVAAAPVLDCYEAEESDEFQAAGLWSVLRSEGRPDLRITSVPWRFAHTKLWPRARFEPVGESTRWALDSVRATIERSPESGVDPCSDQLGGPLGGLKVLEVGDGVAGAFASQLLLQLGATVTKDFPLPDESPSVTAPVTVDRTVREAAYLDQSKTLLARSPDAPQRDSAGADIVIRGVDRATRNTSSAISGEYEALAAARSSLIYLAVTPFATTGGFASWTGGTLQAQAVTGWPAFVGLPEESPLISNYGGGSLQHGLSAACAGLAAYINQSVAPVEYVNVAEADVVAAAIRMYSHTYRMYSIPLKRAGYRAPGCSGRYPHAAFGCLDGEVSVICRTDDEWSRFVAMLGSPAWAEEPRYRDFYAMAVEYPDEVDDLVKGWFASRSKEELASLAVAFRVPMAPLRTIDEVLDDVQLGFRRFFRPTVAGASTVLVPGLPAKWKRSGTATRPAADEMIVSSQ
jgi:crotonobetainyl-CoA:carnitine CoA-transferase CaiB-like acyl-CoA transferase